VSKTEVDTNQLIKDKQLIPSDRNAYIFRREDRGGKWYLYYLDAERGNRHRFLLKNELGNPPKNSLEGREDAYMLGIAKYIELKTKSEKGDAIKTLTFGEMCQHFLDKEKKRISSIPHQGITKARYRLIANQVRWVRDFLNDDKKQIHKFRRNTFMNYETWRKERAIQFEKEIPRQTTINQEMSCLRRLFSEVAENEGYLSKDSIPNIPSIKLSKDAKHRRDDLTANEWEAIERVARLYWVKGKTRILDDEYTIEKDKNGKYKTKVNVIYKGVRGKEILKHREIAYLAMRIAMDTGMRPGSLFKMKWKHVTVNTAIPQEERLTWVNLDIPAENSKTGRSYRIAAPVAKFLESLRKVSRFTKKNDFMFTNQASGKQLSSRIWHGAISDLLVEARLADWTDDSNSQTKKITVHSGKQLSWYSFRHTYITMRLSAGTPIPQVAGNTDTSMKYIQEHYFHYRAEQQTEILSKGRKVTTAKEQLKWIDSLTNN